MAKDHDALLKKLKAQAKVLRRKEIEGKKKLHEALKMAKAYVRTAEKLEHGLLRRIRAKSMALVTAMKKLKKQLRR